MRGKYDDQYWPLRPCPHFQHWLPLPEAGCSVVVRPGRKPVLLRPASSSFWEKPAAPETTAFEQAFDVVRLHGGGSARDHHGPGRVAFVGEDRDGPEALVKALDELRTAKTPYEIACIAEANARAQLGHDALGATLSAPATRPSSICTFSSSRPRGRTTGRRRTRTSLRWASTRPRLHPRRLRPAGPAVARPSGALLVDAAATCRGYCGDVTRTWVQRGRARPRAPSAPSWSAGVEAMQQRLCAAGLARACRTKRCSRRVAPPGGRHPARGGTW